MTFSWPFIFDIEIQLNNVKAMGTFFNKVNFLEFSIYFERVSHEKWDFGLVKVCLANDVPEVSFILDIYFRLNMLIHREFFHQSHFLWNTLYNSRRHFISQVLHSFPIGTKHPGPNYFMWITMNVKNCYVFILIDCSIDDS